MGNKCRSKKVNLKKLSQKTSGKWWLLGIPNGKQWLLAFLKPKNLELKFPKGGNMDKKMAKVTRQMKTAERDIKKHKSSAAIHALKGAEKKNVKLTQCDRDWEF